MTVTCTRCACTTSVVLNENAAFADCPQCQQRLVAAEAVGFTYVLTNSAMPGLVKIGFTTRMPEERVEELQGTAVPVPFVLEAYWSTSTPVEDEVAVHDLLGAQRESRRREFFRMSLGEAIDAIAHHLGRPPDKVTRESPSGQKSAATPAPSQLFVSIRWKPRFVVDPAGNIKDTAGE